jgi:hypothetical protein
LKYAEQDPDQEISSNIRNSEVHIERKLVQNQQAECLSHSGHEDAQEVLHPCLQDIHYTLETPTNPKLTYIISSVTEQGCKETIVGVEESTKLAQDSEDTVAGSDT